MDVSNITLVRLDEVSSINSVDLLQSASRAQVLPESISYNQLIRSKPDWLALYRSLYRASTPKGRSMLAEHAAFERHVQDGIRAQHFYVNDAQKAQGAEVVVLDINWKDDLRRTAYLLEKIDAITYRAIAVLADPKATGLLPSMLEGYEALRRHLPLANMLPEAVDAFASGQAPLDALCAAASSTRQQQTQHAPPPAQPASAAPSKGPAMQAAHTAAAVLSTMLGGIRQDSRRQDGGAGGGPSGSTRENGRGEGAAAVAPAAGRVGTRAVDLQPDGPAKKRVRQEEEGAAPGTEAGLAGAAGQPHRHSAPRKGARQHKPAGNGRAAKASKAAAKGKSTDGLKGRQVLVPLSQWPSWKPNKGEKRPKAGFRGEIKNVNARAGTVVVFSVHEDGYSGRCECIWPREELEKWLVPYGQEVTQAQECASLHEKT
eukprot:CAMPEP_0202368334 /NCGR_PEP_ID=MMETSP1127-20130417/463_1 /ASSEMBLY_ACC=CAM_ASM_000462 /TAXON_ID=3047 /ORGANISM="Dunaliella tertiolecta, Strain CCMP1320" /LENGTH=429 /DNA_ID=CAMNT_0048963741 /DNA_START=80 /DNA_END=1369 /DNA_ORIENTATION=+